MLGITWYDFYIEWTYLAFFTFRSSSNLFYHLNRTIKKINRKSSSKFAELIWLTYSLKSGFKRICQIQSFSKHCWRISLFSISFSLIKLGPELDSSSASIVHTRVTILYLHTSARGVSPTIKYPEPFWTDILVDLATALLSSFYFLLAITITNT